jgi:hypothetical protein
MNPPHQSMVGSVALCLILACSRSAAGACCEQSADANHGIQNCPTRSMAEALGPTCAGCPAGTATSSGAPYSCDPITFTCCNGADMFTCATVTPLFYANTCGCAPLPTNKKKSAVYTNRWIRVNRRDCHDIDETHTICWCEESNVVQFELNHYFWTCTAVDC